MNKNTKHIGQIDQETGEIMQGCMVYIPFRPKITERWFMAFQDAFEEIAKDPELTLEPKNVLFLPLQQIRFRKLHTTKSNRHCKRTWNEEGKCLKSNEIASKKTDSHRRPEGRTIQML